MAFRDGAFELLRRDFAPGLQALAEQHLDRLGLGWRRRAAMLRNPRVDFAELCGFDGRLQAALEALVQLGPLVRESLR